MFWVITFCWFYGLRWWSVRTANSWRIIYSRLGKLLHSAPWNVASFLFHIHPGSVTVISASRSQYQPPKKQFQKGKTKMCFRALLQVWAFYWAAIYGAVTLPLGRVIAACDEKLHIPSMHLLIKAAHIQRYGVAAPRLRLLWKIPLAGCIFWVINVGAAESRSPILKSGVNQEVSKSAPCEFTAVLCVSLHLSHPISQWHRLSPPHYFVRSTSNGLSKISVSMQSVAVINTIIFSHSLTLWIRRPFDEVCRLTERYADRVTACFM